MRKIAAHTACSAQEKWVWRYGDNIDSAKEIYYMDGTGKDRGLLENVEHKILLCRMLTCILRCAILQKEQRCS